MHNTQKAKSASRYEIAVRREGRWIIDCLTAGEAEARERAEALYADETVEAVRVTRGHFGQDGLVYESLIHDQAREPRRGETPVRIGRRPDEDARCESLDDLYGPASRRAIARLLRNFLDRHGITPTELLHQHRYIRLLERQDALGSQALQRMAGLQAARDGTDARARLDTLTRFTDTATARARDAMESRAIPRLGAKGLKALADEIAAAVTTPPERAFYLRCAVSLAFEELGDPAEKLAMALSWTADLPDTLLPLIDEIVAGLLGGAALVQHLLGPQSHLASALCTLAGLIRGHVSERAPPLLASLAAVSGDPRMPETQGELMERIAREVASAKPLSRDDLAVQRRLYDELLGLLTTDEGLILGGVPMVGALAARSRRLEIIGGIDTVRFTSDDIAQRFDQVMALASGIHSERQLRALATYSAQLLDELPPTTDIPAIEPKLAAVRFAEQAKAALLARLRARAPGIAA